MRKCRLLAGTLACLFALAGCRGAGRVSPPTPSLHDPERLVIYTPHREDIYQPIIREFEERTGIWVTVVTGGSNELFELLANEGAAPVCDVMFGGSAESHDAYGQWLEPYEAVGLDTVDESLLSSSGLWTPFSVLPIVIVYNTKLVPALQRPQGWADLLDSTWKGRIAFADPAVSASSYTGLSAIAQVFPGAEWEAITAFADNLNGEVLDSSGQIPATVVDGKYAVGITLEEAAFRARQEGKEISFVYPTEGTCAVPDATSLIKGAPHGDNGKRFIDFTLTRDIQHMITTQFSRRSVVAESDPPNGLLPLKDLKLLPYDYAWSVSNHKDILERWRREF